MPVVRRAALLLVVAALALPFPALAERPRTAAVVAVPQPIHVVTGHPRPLGSYLAQGFTPEQAVRVLSADLAVAGGAPVTAVEPRVTATPGTYCGLFIFAFTFYGNVQPAGDLDGDGRPDVLESHYVALGKTKQVWLITARDARTGRPHWVHREVQDVNHGGYALGMRVGPTGRPGVVLVDQRVQMTNETLRSALDIQLQVTGLDGRGRPLWHHHAQGTMQTDLLSAGWTYTHVPFQVVTAQLRPGAEDVLIGSYTQSPSGGLLSTITGPPGRARYSPRLVSGATGRVTAPAPDAVTSGSFADGGLLPDQDGDGLQDLWTAVPDGTSALTVYRGRTGALLWRNTTLLLTDFVLVEDAGRIVNGESRLHDVAVSTAGPFHGTRLETPIGPLGGQVDTLVALVGGGTGAAAWVRSGETAYPVQFAGAPRVAALGVATSEVQSSDLPLLGSTATLSMDIVMYDALGLPVTSTRYSYSHATKGCAAGATLIELWPGDVDADHDPDGEIYFLITDESDHFYEDQQVVRTGDGKVLQHTLSFAAGGSVDGRGDDRVSLDITSSAASITMLRGDDGRRLWTRRQASQGKLDGFGTYVLPATSDRCQDVLLLVSGKNGSTTQLLSSGGQPWWTVSYAPNAERGRLTTERQPKRFC